MSVPLRSGPSSWRRAGTVVLAARGPAARQSADGFRLLLLQRAQNQRFLPGAHVFPGGVLHAADSSADWLRLFAPRHTPPRFGLGPAPPSQHPFPGLPYEDAGAGALPDDVALRICAIRETFEEAGVLLLRPRSSPPASQEPGLALPPPPGLGDWRSRVRSDPRYFLQLCEHLDCTPDIWALRNWSGWLTPVGSSSRRFDTSFHLCCLRETPRVEPDKTEVVGYKWLSPAEATECFLSKEIWLAPPQFYEMRRLETFTSLSALYSFSSARPFDMTEKWMPIILSTADGSIMLFPGMRFTAGEEHQGPWRIRLTSWLTKDSGDELYVKDANFIENPMSTDKKTEEILKEGKVVHRLVPHKPHLYELYVSVRSNKHVYPKNFTVDASLTSRL